MKFNLFARGIYCLAEVTLLIQQPYRHYRYPKVAGRFQEIPCQYAQTTAVQREGLRNTVFHTEPGYSITQFIVVGLGVPGRRPGEAFTPADLLLVEGKKIRVLG